MSEQPVTPGEEPGFEWMIVEIFGHRRHAGRVREEERFGARMLRIDIPRVERRAVEGTEAKALVPVSWTTHLYGGSAIFSATLTDEVTILRINAPYEAPSRYLAGPGDDDASDGVVF